MQDHRQFINKLRSFAHRTDMKRVEEAVQTLRPLGDNAVLGLAGALEDDDDYVRVMALEILYEWEGDTSAVLNSVIRSLDDDDRIVRICAASVVSQHVEKAGDALPVLLRWLDGDDEHSRLTAAALILRIDPSQDSEMLKIMAEGTKSEDSAIRCLTAWLLSGLKNESSEAGPLLQQMLTDPDELVRQVVDEELQRHS